MNKTGVPSPTSPTNPIIVLNVGGTIYSTTLQTLISNPNTLFSSLLRTLPRDRDGNIFIDRDHLYFRYILDSLRLGEIQHPFPSGSYESIRLWKEIDFFRLLAPGHLWNFSKKKKLRHSSLYISDDGFLVKKNSKSKLNFASVCGNKVLNNEKYKFRVITRGITGGIIFGLLPNTTFKLSELNLKDLYGLSTGKGAYNLERYGAISEDDDEEEDEETDEDEDEEEDEEESDDENKKKVPDTLFKLDVDLNKRVILNESGDEEHDENSDEETKGNEEDKKEIVKDLDDESHEASFQKPVIKTSKIQKEQTFLVEYDSANWSLKIYKQDEEIWYSGKIQEKIEGYNFFAALQNIEDQLKIELLE